MIALTCIFCDYLDKRAFVLENEFAFAINDNYPVNKGHMLIIPKRHFADFFDAAEVEYTAFVDLIKEAKKLLDEKYKPDGYNIGVNVNKAAGQTIFHLHIHLIPRYDKDIDDPRGGVRKIKVPLVEYDG